MGQQGAARVGQADAASVPFDDRDAEHLPDPGDGPGHGRLRGPQHRGGERHLLDLGDRDERGQQGQEAAGLLVDGDIHAPSVCVDSQTCIGRKSR
ncbi:hypothetical protein D3C74_398150 [compost metagenome]